MTENAVKKILFYKSDDNAATDDHDVFVLFTRNLIWKNY